MLLSKKSKKKILPRVLSDYLNNPKIKFFATFSIFLTILVFAIFIIKPSLIRPELSQLKTEFTTRLRQATAAYKARPQNIQIDIAFDDFQKIVNSRETALKNGILLGYQTDFVPATIVYNGKSYGAQVRLKGVGFDHWTDEKKWSLKVRIDNDLTIMGMNEFSIMHPQTRNYIDEWIYTQALKKEGLLYPRVEYIRVSVNGRNNGIYIMEEDFGKVLVENNRRREGPLIGFEKELILEEWVRGLAREEQFATGSVGTFEATPSEIIPNIDSTPDGISLAAIQQLEGFRLKDLTVGQAYNLEDTARYLALRALFGSLEFDPNDIKFYYNPVTAKLEFFAAEINRSGKVGAWWLNQGPDREKSFSQLFFDDEKFFEAYVKILKDYTESDFLGTLINDVEKDLEENLNIIYSEFPENTLDKKGLLLNQQFIADTISPPAGIHAYFNSASSDSIEIDIGNIQSLPVEIISLSHNNFTELLTQKSVILKPKEKLKAVDFETIIFSSNQNFSQIQQNPGLIEINYKIVGSDKIMKATVTPYTFNNSNINSNIIFQNPNVGNFPNLIVDETNKKIIISSGIWKLKQDLIVPPDFVLIAREATNIELSQGAKIISYSPFDFSGSQENPITLSSPDSTGQGLIVLNAKKESILNNVVFENLSAPGDDGWQPTGAVTFFESPVSISESLFKNSQSEDSLNIIGSEFKISDSSFSQSIFDAVDIDFGSGVMKNNIFIDSGNDAIDISESHVELSEIEILGADDKGISVGENSSLDAKKINIDNSYIAVAIKDRSKSHIDGIKISNSKFGFAVYEKKAQYGAASAQVINLLENSSNTKTIVEQDSTLNINFIEFDDYKSNVYQLLYPQDVN